MRTLAALLLLALSAPARAEPNPAEPIHVVASFSILADLARGAGGDAVEVTSLVGPDADPHGYEPRPSDARKVAGASVLVLNGFGFDSWVDRLATASGFHGIRVVATAGVTPILHDGTPDPHAWQSAPNAIAYVDAIADGLAASRPDEADAIRASAAAYQSKLRTLDTEIRTTLQAVPQDRRTIVVPHRAFDYFGRAYGIAFLAPLGTNADAEATGAEMARVVDRLRRGEAQAIFTEHLEDRRIVARIAAEARLPITGELYSDALSGPSGPAPDYVTLMRRNARLIAEALGPEAATKAQK